MDAQELKTKTEDELKKILLDLRKEQFNARFQQSQGTFENTAQVRKARRTIARIKTVMNQKSLEAPKKAATKAKKKAA
jgi:large subunit ribosomal protein L29